MGLKFYNSLSSFQVLMTTAWLIGKLLMIFLKRKVYTVNGRI